MRRPSVASSAGAGRLLSLDVARGVALLGMVIFHLCYDLALAGLIPRDVPTREGWRLFAKLVAGSFLFLSGVSLWLAHGRGIRWPVFVRRIGVLALAAAAISATTYAMAPDRFVYFGILHAIAVSNLLALAFLRLPALLTLLVAGGVWALPRLVALPALDHPALHWIGLSTWHRPSMDFEPLFPWAAATLAGLACTRLATAAGLWPRLREREKPAANLLHPLGWPGRHSLAIYLIHQPVLVAVTQAIARLT
ncbi:heparan-alpha-glucosaminide N-acetyltransferase [Salipiger mucosus]|uniref:Heparan-alpha-glucosaminide N-acetyltransferase catalytic domain-containing protein n=1 Tax=Salipiger mucosus DSM 16094 TaxID=1123237 RepID=S9QZL1_9RHOB|nr:heparan-alpha-glucosaminide N-acetyltransferase [Salipiger mucosus]EPX85037.1 hypothetical protein Salmuc_00635 [Salipiger mucosus DSM 16094]